MLRRKITCGLEAWRAQPQRKALLVTGARQIGKSCSLRELGRTRYRASFEVNLLENPVARRALAEARDVRDFISRITVMAPDRLPPGETLIFIDEIQELPDIMTWAKFLVEDGRYDWAFSGSMLGTEFKGVRSYPVGYVHELQMFPMDFEEFCWALDLSSEAFGAIVDACEKEESVAPYLHDAMLANFRTYLVTGGMPEVVQRFLDTQGDLGAVRELQTELNRQYRHDISKYAASRALQVQSIFDQLPVQLEGDSQRFVLNSVDPEARFEKYQRDFVWLVNAGVGLKTDLVDEPLSPLLKYAQPSRFKLYQSDTGMLMARYPQSLAQATYLDDKHPNLGGIYENAVAQQLTASGHSLFYFMTKKRGEVDFVVDGPNGTAVLLEVKSGRYYHAHAALDHVLENPAWNVEQGIVLSRNNVERTGRVLYLPLYATFYLERLLAPKSEPLRLAVHRV